MNYAQLVDNFHYSSGESPMASSDAQNVDYGIGALPHVDYIGQDDQENAGTPNQTKNASPDYRVSDFGSVWYPFGSVQRKAKKQRPVPVAGKPASEGAGRTVGPIRGAPNGGGMVGRALRPLDPMRSTFGTLNGQNENAVGQQYIGQLN